MRNLASQYIWNKKTCFCLRSSRGHPRKYIKFKNSLFRVTGGNFRPVLRSSVETHERIRKSNPFPVVLLGKHTLRIFAFCLRYVPADSHDNNIIKSKPFCLLLLKKPTLRKFASGFRSLCRNPRGYKKIQTSPLSVSTEEKQSIRNFAFCLRSLYESPWTCLEPRYTMLLSGKFPRFSYLSLFSLGLPTYSIITSLNLVYTALLHTLSTWNPYVCNVQTKSYIGHKRTFKIYLKIAAKGKKFCTENILLVGFFKHYAKLLLFFCHELFASVSFKL
jgi:hypothetical protein